MADPGSRLPDLGAGELLDYFDESGRHLGVLPRTEIHHRGLWHRVAHFLVVAQRPEGPAAILQRRARTKLTFPGLVDLSATGHLSAGESPADGVRELREELGVEVDPGDLVPLGVRRMTDQTPEGTNRELIHGFIVRDDRPLGSYRPDPLEVSGVIEVQISALLAILAPPAGDRSGRWAPAIELAVDESRSSRALTPANLVPEPLSDRGLLSDRGTLSASAARGDEDRPMFAYWTSVLEAGLAVAEGRPPVPF